MVRVIVSNHKLTAVPECLIRCLFALWRNNQLGRQPLIPNQDKGLFMPVQRFSSPGKDITGKAG